jgi:hypothetical protein
LHLRLRSRALRDTYEHRNGDGGRWRLALSFCAAWNLRTDASRSETNFLAAGVCQSI